MLIPAVFVLLVYLPSLKFGLVWDDTIFLRDLPIYRSSGNWMIAFNQAFVLSPNYYRPLPLLTFIAELHLGGLNATLFHLTNLVLHTLNTTLVSFIAYSVLRKCPPSGRKWLAVTAGLLYGMHPALIEGVVFISSRFDLLLTFFLLLALLADIKLAGWKRAALVGLLFFLAALSKEMAVAFALALPLWHLIRQEDEGCHLSWQDRLILYQQKKDWQVQLTVVLAGVVYLGVRYAGLGYLLNPQVESGERMGSLLQQGLLVGISLAEYIKLVIWPFTSLTPIHYSELPLPTSAFAGWLAWVAVLLILASIFSLSKKQPRFSLMMLAGILTLLPVSNLMPIELGGGAFIAERFLLFPMLFFVIAFIFLAEDLAWVELNFVKLVVALWMILSIGTIQLTVPHWRDNLSLWHWAAERAPQSATPFTNLSLEYTNIGNHQQGLLNAQAAIQRDQTEGNAWNNAGLAFFGMQRFEDALSAFSQALAIDPKSALYANNLAAAYRELGDLGEAERLMLDVVLPLDPNLPIAYLNLGLIYLRADRPDLAVLALQDAQTLLPEEMKAQAEELLLQTEDPQRWLSLGEGLMSNQALQEALSAFQQAGALGADHTDVWLGISNVLMMSGDWGQAQEILLKTLSENGGDPRIYYNLGIIAREQGDLDSARNYFNQAILLAPEWEAPKQALEEIR